MRAWSAFAISLILKGSSIESGRPYDMRLVSMVAGAAVAGYTLLKRLVEFAEGVKVAAPRSVPVRYSLVKPLP